ncbi:hypothetical protein [Hyalangium versicolor]|uniref:hypothetical protein n=1 Tax=Hyalangium versicolor TaxID=2861190 RepID=UPI001CCEFBB5|nr:hypothetical protein [Hyalangium versicolor]
MTTRQRKNAISPPSTALPPALANWAEAIGIAIGQGVVRALHNSGLSSAPNGPPAPIRRRGRPPKVVVGGPVPPERLCTVPGCGRESRSKGLCSAHYQAERRRMLAAGKSA